MLDHTYTVRLERPYTENGQEWGESIDIQASSLSMARYRAERYCKAHGYRIAARTPAKVTELTGVIPNNRYMVVWAIAYK